MTATDQDAVTRVVVNAGKSIAAFERLLTCGTTPFDRWMHDGDPISPEAERGAALFVGKGGCVGCHSGPFLSDQKFHDVGLLPVTVQQAFIDSNDEGAAAGLAAAIADPLNTHGAFSDGDDGRLPTTVGPAMTGAFRTPMLRCVSLRPTFMHTGQIATLADVVAFFDQGGSVGGYLGTSEIHALGLTPVEQSDLVAFLESLSGPGAEPDVSEPPVDRHFGPTAPPHAARSASWHSPNSEATLAPRAFPWLASRVRCACSCPCRRTASIRRRPRCRGAGSDAQDTR